jgi:hypothetical protein
MTDIAWNFTGDTLRDWSPIPPIGHTLVYPGQIEMCEAGYHWSLTPWEALRYAPGSMLHKVRVGGSVIYKDDKGVSSERTILASLDATYLLQRFAADQALSVAHLWNMPEVVRECLTTLDPKKREKAAAVALAEEEAAWVAWVAWVAAAGVWRPEQAARAAALEAALVAERAEEELFDTSIEEAAADFNARVYAAFETDVSQ